MTQYSSDRDRSAAAALVTPPAAFPAAAVIRALPASGGTYTEPDFAAASHPVSTMSLRAWLLAFLAWTLFGIFSANQSLVFYALTDLEVSTRDTYLVTLGAVWLWVLFTPAIVWLARRFRIERDFRLQRLLVHFGFAFLFSVADPVLDKLLYPMVSDLVDPSTFLQRFFFQLDINLFSYFIIAAATHAVDYYRLYRERRVRAAELANQLTSAQLQVLKMQLQPHFLFNTLNAISELVHEDAEAADRMITRLGDLLRLSLEMSGEQEVPLRQELDFLTAYLEIEQTRFRDRLSIQMDIAPETLDASVPNLLLQPLVENAIKHGTGARAAAGRIAIATNRGNGSLRIEIRDNGRGLPHPAVLREGVGLRNTRARLVQLYGESHGFTLRNATDGGTVVSIEIPYRPAPHSAREMSSLDSSLT